MKRLIPLLLLSLISGCRNEKSHEVISGLTDHGAGRDTTTYPIFINGRSRMVYQFGHMTADKGLKVSIDTTFSPGETLIVVDAMQQISTE